MNIGMCVCMYVCMYGRVTVAAGVHFILVDERGDEWRCLRRRRFSALTTPCTLYLGCVRVQYVGYVPMYVRTRRVQMPNYQYRMSMLHKINQH